MFLYRPSNLLHIKIIQGLVYCVCTFFGGVGEAGIGCRGGCSGEKEFSIGRALQPSITIFEDFCLLYCCFKHSNQEQIYSYNFTKNTRNIVSNAVCTAGNTGVPSVLIQFLLWARDNGVLSCGGGLYLTSEIYSASRTSVEENIASVSDVGKSSENNMFVTF